MKKEKGLGIIGTIIIVCIIIAVITGVTIILSKIFKNAKNSDILSNMLLIQGTCKVLNDNALVNKNENDLVGLQLSKFTDDENANEEKQEEQAEEETNNEDNNKEESTGEETNNKENEKLRYDKIITEFKKQNIISEEDYEKYYVLTDDDLGKLKLNFKNEKNSYYLINYKDSEVIITKGYKGKYKLSELEAESTNE